MIKLIRFVSRRPELPATDFATAWPSAALRVAARHRPRRAVACTTLHGVAGAHAPHDGVAMEWFADLSAAQQARQHLAAEDDVVDPEATVVVIATEEVKRGADWLARRFEEPTVKFKHMALARRADGLSAQQFAERWRGHAGTVGGGRAAPAITIAPRARGHAYVQNHPVQIPAAQWRYDAINEVYFDDVEAMRARIAFFQDNDVARASADLVSEAAFMAVEEWPIRIA